MSTKRQRRDRIYDGKSFKIQQLSKSFKHAHGEKRVEDIRRTAFAKKKIRQMVTKSLVTVGQERRLVHQSVYICNVLDCLSLRLKTYSAMFYGISLESTSLHYCKHDVLAYNGLMGPLLIISP